MPVVRYGPRKVGADALPGVRKTAAETDLSTGVGLAQAKGQSSVRQLEGLARLGDTTAQIGLGVVGKEALAIRKDAQDQADEDVALAFKNRLSEFDNNFLYDPQNGALNKKGFDAQGVPEEAAQAFEKVVGDLNQGLNDRQRRLVAPFTAQHAENLHKTVMAHASREGLAFRDQELKSFVVNAENAAAANARDPIRVNEELANAVGAIQRFSPRLGVGPQEVQQQVEAVQTRVHTSVIESLLALDQPRNAKIYYEEKQGEIAGTQRAKIEKALNEGTLRGTAQKASDAILRAGGSLTDQRDKARQIDDPELRDAVMQRIEHEADVAAKATRDSDERTLRGVYDIVDRTHDVTQIPPAVWVNLDGQDRRALRAYSDSLAKGIPVETDLPTYYGLMQKAANDPEAFSTENLLKYRGKLDQTEFKQLAGLQLSIRAKDKPTVDKELAGFRTHDQIVRETLWQYTQTEESKYTTEQKNAKALLLRLVDQRVAAAQDQGKKVTNDEVQGILDDILSQKETKPGTTWYEMFFQSKGWQSPVTKRLLDWRIEDLAPKERADLEKALRDTGHPVSDSTILDLYLNLKSRKQAP